MLITGIVFALLGLVLAMTSVNKVAEIIQDNAAKKVAKKFNLNHKGITLSKKILIYIWHYSGWFFTGVGSTLIYTHIFGPIL